MKILIKCNAYLKKAVFHSSENIKSCIFTAVKNISCISQLKFDVLCFVHWLSLAHFRSEFQTPVTFLLVDKNTKWGYSFS